MVMITIKNFKKEFGDKLIFDKAELTVQDNDKIALIGQNGSGKTTLARCITGEEDFDGMIDTNGRKIAIMQQEIDQKDLNLTFKEYLESKQDSIKVKRLKLEEAMGDPKIFEDYDKYDKVLKEYEQICQLNLDSIEDNNFKITLELFDLDFNIINRKLSEISGGQRTILRICECIRKEADVYILDEPTNYLDINALKILELWVRKMRATFILISHDRYFINKFSTKIVEIENKKLITYDCDYDTFVKRRTERRMSMLKEYLSYKQKKKRMTDNMEEKRRWAHLDGSRKLRIIADRIERQLINLGDLDNPEEFEQKFKLKCYNGIRPSGEVVSLKNISKSYGNLPIFKDLNLDIFYKDKIALLGANGIGKSTLLKIITEKIKQDSGDVKYGYEVKVGYFDQFVENMPVNKTVMDYLREVHTDLDDYKLMDLARNFGFEHDIEKKKIKKLSGGEKARIELLRILLGGYNFIILDEPTNHLDLELRETLEEALKDYEGTMIFVSHDRYFVDKFANKIAFIEDGKINVMDGNYSKNF